MVGNISYLFFDRIAAESFRYFYKYSYYSFLFVSSACVCLSEGEKSLHTDKRNVKGKAVIDASVCIVV